ncbi:hypothetical protein GCM10027399_01450 [Curvibacter fontanus]
MPAFHAIVWLDRSEAHVILFDREHIAAQKIKSRSHHKATGGHSSGDESYHHSIAEALKDVHEILITGPAQAKDEFKAHCARHDQDIDKAIVGVITSDHPSDGQLVAMAKQYFLKYDQMNRQL